MRKIKEILKTDSLAGSRIVINRNFANLELDITEIDKFYIFDSDGNRIGIKTPILTADRINVLELYGNETIKIFNNNILCIDFNDNGELLIRKDGNCSFNVKDEIEKAAGAVIDIDGIINAVESSIIKDEAFIEEIAKKLMGNEVFTEFLVDRIISNETFTNKVIELIDSHCKPAPQEECKLFSVYSKGAKIMIHCETDPDQSKDYLLENYTPSVENTIIFTKSKMSSIIDEYYDGTGNEFDVVYTDRNGETHRISDDGTYESYNDGILEYIVVCSDFLNDTTYTITIKS